MKLQRSTIGFLVTAASTVVMLWLSQAYTRCRGGDPAGCGLGEAIFLAFVIIATAYVALLCALFTIRRRWVRIALAVLLAPLTGVAVFLLVVTISAA